jgi:hypothetical protein
VKRLVKFWRLPAAERRLLVSALAYLAAYRIGLWVLPLPGLLRRAQTWQVSETCQVLTEPERIAWALRVAGRYLPGGRNCLAQALAGRALLARRGCPAQLRIGVAAAAGERFRAHAWVEHEGRILIGAAGAAGYTPLPPLEGRRP